MMKLITVKEYCALKAKEGVDLTRHQVYAMIKSGELYGEKTGVNNSWLVEYPINEANIKWVTSKEVAEQIGTTVRSVTKMCSEGQLLAKKEKGRWLIGVEVISDDCGEEESNTEEALLDDQEEMDTEEVVKESVRGLVDKLYWADRKNSLSFTELYQIIGKYMAKLDTKIISELYKQFKCDSKYEIIDKYDAIVLIEIIHGILSDSKVSKANLKEIDNIIIDTFNDEGDTIWSVDTANDIITKLANSVHYITKASKELKKMVYTVIIKSSCIQSIAKDLAIEAVQDFYKEEETE